MTPVFVSVFSLTLPSSSIHPLSAQVSLRALIRVLILNSASILSVDARALDTSTAHTRGEYVFAAFSAIRRRRLFVFCCEFAQEQWRKQTESNWKRDILPQRNNKCRNAERYNMKNPLYVVRLVDGAHNWLLPPNRGQMDTQSCWKLATFLPFPWGGVVVCYANVAFQGCK